MDSEERATIDAEVIEVQTERARQYDELAARIKQYSEAVGTVRQINLQTVCGSIALSDTQTLEEADAGLVRRILELKLEQAAV